MGTYKVTDATRVEQIEEYTYLFIKLERIYLLEEHNNNKQDAPEFLNIKIRTDNKNTSQSTYLFFSDPQLQIEIKQVNNPIKQTERKIERQTEQTEQSSTFTTTQPDKPINLTAEQIKELLLKVKISDVVKRTEKTFGTINNRPTNCIKCETIALKVSDEKRIFYCFNCGWGGDALTYLMEKEKLRREQAIEILQQMTKQTEGN